MACDFIKERAGLIRDTGITRRTASGRSERIWSVA